MAGIWTPPGLTADNSGHILAAVGNGNFGNQKYDYSDSVLEFSTSLKLTDHFSPSNWRAENANDADLGSQGATMVGQWVFIDGKGGNAYVLRRNHFGGVGGQVSKRALCTSFGGTAVRPATVYVPCTDGVRAVRIDSSGRMHVLWHAASNINGSPVIGGGHLFALDPNAGRLYELSLTNGRVVRSVSVGAVNRFATPALYGRNLRVGTLTGVVDVRTS
jgi:outer membrane protein assembly factor BamB